MGTQISRNTNNKVSNHQTSPTNQPTQTLFTIEQFAAAESAFTPLALRSLIFKAEPRYSANGIIPGNGLKECGAVVRIGRKVMIHRDRFLEWVQK
jgi:hypothetical protein